MRVLTFERSVTRPAEECDPVSAGAGESGRAAGHGATRTGAAGARGRPTDRTVPMRSGSDDSRSPSPT